MYVYKRAKNKVELCRDTKNKIKMMKNQLNMQFILYALMKIDKKKNIVNIYI